MGMAQLVVRNLENSVKARLQRWAKRNGHSMEAEVRDILRAAAQEGTTGPRKGFGTEMSKLFTKNGLKEPIPELRGYPVKPATFGQ
jgi:antitoxin FitA